MLGPPQPPRQRQTQLRMRRCGAKREPGACSTCRPDRCRTPPKRPPGPLPPASPRTQAACPPTSCAVAPARLQHLPGGGLQLGAGCGGSLLAGLLWLLPAGHADAHVRLPAAGGAVPALLGGLPSCAVAAAAISSLDRAGAAAPPLPGQAHRPQACLHPSAPPARPATAPPAAGWVSCSRAQQGRLRRSRPWTSRCWALRSGARCGRQAGMLHAGWMKALLPARGAAREGRCHGLAALGVLCHSTSCSATARRAAPGANSASLSGHLLVPAAPPHPAAPTSCPASLVPPCTAPKPPATAWRTSGCRGWAPLC